MSLATDQADRSEPAPASGRDRVGLPLNQNIGSTRENMLVDSQSGAGAGWGYWQSCG